MPDNTKNNLKDVIDNNSKYNIIFSFEPALECVLN